ncbi:hypothetical protein GGX14DRAFT_405890 [Mycena pura]|uniref:Uncharacterized protein n=1 Tax=Mycena pura TaxID=153505 RepID=A0AAD6UV14_9AGAR|nr:hypothetical protein GGX14DRAFT_405890 [Mycena pura]
MSLGTIDLLRNRDPSAPLGSFDGRVGALASLGAEHYFITTNADYIPALPSLKVPHALFLRSNMRYGSDDPTLWPQQYTTRFCHFPAISKKGTRPELDVMWWNPSPHDFIVGSAVTRGLGKLRNRCIEKFLPFVNEVVAICKELKRTSRTPISPLFGELIQHILMLLEQLQTLPTTYTKTVFAVTSLQRACLELDVLYYYITVYKPRIDSYFSCPPNNPTSIAGGLPPLAQCIGAFTTIPGVAQQLWSAGLPFWFLRPTFVFDSENILSIVPLEEACFEVPDTHADGTPPIVYSGNSTEDKIAAIHSAAKQNPWYRDPFETAARTSHQVARQRHERPHYKPYNYPKLPMKGPERDKFKVLTVPAMPPSIAAWADALGRVDQSVTPFTSNPADRRYVFPEAALFANTTPEQQRKYLHHWCLLRDGFAYLLSQPEHHSQLLSAQQWRDVLNGLVTKRGHSQSRSHRRSTELEELIRPALEACNVTSVEGFPVAPESLPEFSLMQTREILGRWPKPAFVLNFVLWTVARRQRIGCLTSRLASRVMEALEAAVCEYYTQAFWEHFSRAAVVPLRLDHDVEKEEVHLSVTLIQERRLVPSPWPQTSERGANDYGNLVEDT